jgi:hypothetical protein
MSPFVDDDEDVCCSPESSSCLLSSSSSSSTFGINKENLRRPTKPKIFCVCVCCCCFFFCSFLVILPKTKNRESVDLTVVNYIIMPHTFWPVYKINIFLLKKNNGRRTII